MSEPDVAKLEARLDWLGSERIGERLSAARWSSEGVGDLLELLDLIEEAAGLSAAAIRATPQPKPWEKK